tara:strand:+ start:203 stop:463 length:261 start_codon:yes stop_codon:yes gene_type:complete
LIDSFGEAIRYCYEGDSTERANAIRKHPELEELIIIVNAMNNGVGSLKEILEIKEKHGFELIKNINTVRNVVNTLQEQDSRTQRVG